MRICATTILRKSTMVKIIANCVGEGDVRVVFISYSSIDYDAACTIRSVLENNSIRCWMAPESIPLGGDYSSAIPDAIENCIVFLLILSKNSQVSNWVPKELDLAITYNKSIIPFQIDNGMLTKPFNFRLTNIQRIEAFHNLENAYSKLLSQIKTETGEMRSDLAVCELPKKYSYYQMLGINDISQITIKEMRERTDITSSLAVPIGINSDNETVYLDLHQKGDGPHGLIIGPVGSGKSEFLLTLCLSLCLFFSPEEIRIHVIDQKGGGMVHELEGLPHLGMCLTESTDEAVNRFINTIDNEVQRRFRLLENYSASNIYQYLKKQKSSIDKMEEMPHLVIVFDELRMLKVEYPEIFAKIKAWGSKMNASLLGVHIIFSTQNYAGLIDDSIWKMSDYKICSTMQRDELSFVKSANTSRFPGRLYLQSRSSSKVQLIQLAYCCTEIDEGDAAEFGWFFTKKSEKNEIIDLIMRHELD